MGQIRLLVGTSKGGFLFTSDASRRRWDVTGPLFEGWEVYHLYALPGDPDRLWASLWTPWYGNVIQTSGDGGRTWQVAGGEFRLEPPIAAYKSLGGATQPWQFRRVWRFASPPSASGERNAPTGGPVVLFAGAEDAALFRSEDGGRTWRELAALRHHPTHEAWEPGAGGLCLHTLGFDPTRPGRMLVAISAAGVFRSDDGGATWRPANRGLYASHTADSQPEAGYCVHSLVLHPARPEVVYIQAHSGVYRSDDAGESWRNVSEGLPSPFGFPIAVHAHDPDTVYVVPMKDDERHFPVDGALRVWRSRDGGGTWEPLSDGLPGRHFYGNVLRGAMAVDTLYPCGLYFGTTTGEVYASADEGDSWEALALHLPRILSVEAHTVGAQ
ncbi:MAG: exo-alpha-sialidase [Limnochordaceae bacterium]|nr:exo-alpha-sialidase [Limnochordaceae bacterium]